MEIKKLKSMPYANAFVEIIDDKNFNLWSYRTLVCKVEDNILTVNGLYSMTTRKHISAFVKEYCNTNYRIAKQLYEDKFSLDISTGEIFDIK